MNYCLSVIHNPHDRSHYPKMAMIRKHNVVLEENLEGN